MERNQVYVNATATKTRADVDQEDIELSEMSERSALSLATMAPPASAVGAGLIVPLPSTSTVQRPNGLGLDLFSPRNFDERDSNVNYLPSKSEMLHYFTQAQNFIIKRINNDVQITDPEGFPLFDAWVDVNFCYKFWHLEAYGRTVLVMREPITWGNDFARPRIMITDWNGDFFGALVPGDPFVLLSTERQPVAKLIPHKSPTADGIDSARSPPKMKACWLCILEGNGRHIARLEDYQSIQFNKDVAFHLKLLTLAAIVRLVGQLNPTNNFACMVKYLLNCCSSGS